MDVITIKLIENKTILPLEAIIYINSFINEKLNDNNFKQAVKLWFKNKEECIWRFGHISCWNTIRITNMREIFENKFDFNDDISNWNVSNVTDMEC